MIKKVSMIGCGKLGKECGEVMAQYYNVVGYDIDQQIVPSNFLMVNNVKDAVVHADFIFIAVPTPHDQQYGGEKPSYQLEPKDFDYKILQNTVNEVIKYINDQQILVIISTVLPGTIRNLFSDIIEKYQLIYNPYLIAMGTVKDDMRNPEMVIIGSNQHANKAVQKLVDFYKLIIQNNCRYEIGTFDEAECIKIFYNTFISTKIALVNMIQDVAQVNGNINVDIVTKALANSTQRIMSPAYMTAGMGDGGACHPRDNIALRYLAKNYNLGYDLFQSIVEARDIQAKNLAKFCLNYGHSVTIIGKAYKKGTNLTNGSYSLLVGDYIKQLGATVSYYDPNTNDTEFIHNNVMLIAYWDTFVESIKFPNNVTIIDPWRKLNFSDSYKVIHYGNKRNI